MLDLSIQFFKSISKKGIQLINLDINHLIEKLIGGGRVS